MVEKFTKILYELVVEKEISLQDSLKIISKKSKKINFCKLDVIEKTAKFIINELLCGNSFSNALRRCVFIHFDDIYISFVNFAEKTGQLKETISFLYRRCIRKKENHFKLIEASVYPLLVIVSSILGCLFLHLSGYFHIDNDFYIYISLLVLISILVFFVIKKNIGENKLYEAFLGIGFLMKAGINLYDSIGCGARILGISSKLGDKFQQAREKLLLGMNLEKSFSLGKRFSSAFFFAEMGGGKVDVFEKLAKWIEDNDRKKRSVCFSLIEPVFILITGAFLLMVVINIFMPFISKLSFI